MPRMQCLSRHRRRRKAARGPRFSRKMERGGRIPVASIHCVLRIRGRASLRLPHVAGGLIHSAGSKRCGADYQAAGGVCKPQYDRAAPPANMPPLGTGETAVCDADFLARSSVRGQPRRTDASHGILTITQVMVTLQLQINVWLPIEGAQVLADHEEGHRNRKYTIRRRTNSQNESPRAT